MTVHELRTRLRSGAQALSAILSAVDDEEAAWKPDSDRWSLLEIVNHLADEEALDFRTRLQMILKDPKLDWPAFNPFGGIEDGSYGRRDFAESVSRLRNERTASLSWLESLVEVDAGVRYAGRGSEKRALTAGDLMSSWIAHDYFHLRQITRLRWDYLASERFPYSPDYAGFE